MLRKALGFASIAALGTMFPFVLFWAPIEANMGIVQKIMYIHVPSIIIRRIFIAEKVH